MPRTRNKELLQAVREQISSQLSTATSCRESVSASCTTMSAIRDTWTESGLACYIELSENDSATVAQMLARLKQFVEGFQQLERSDARPATS